MVEAVGSCVLPEYRLAQGTQAEVAGAAAVAAAGELVGVGVAHAPAGAFNAAPDVYGSWLLYSNYQLAGGKQPVSARQGAALLSSLLR